jgi:hypothetical protein
MGVTFRSRCPSSDCSGSSGEPVRRTLILLLLLLLPQLLAAGEPAGGAPTLATAIEVLTARLSDELATSKDRSLRSMFGADACAALVMVGRPDSAQALYRVLYPQAAPDGSDDRPDLTARWRIDTLALLQASHLRRFGAPSPALEAEMDALAAPITVMAWGKDAVAEIAWLRIRAWAIAGRLDEAMALVQALGEKDFDCWRLGEVLAAAWRAGHRDAVDRVTNRIIVRDGTVREAFAHARLRVGDRIGGERILGRREAFEKWRWQDAVASELVSAGHIEEAEQYMSERTEDWRFNVGRNLVRQGRLAEADRWLSDAPVDERDDAVLLWHFARADPAVVLAAVGDPRNRGQALERLGSILLRDWPAEPQRAAADQLRRLVRTWCLPDDPLPGEGTHGADIALATCVLIGDWTAAEAIRVAAVAWDDDTTDRILRDAIFELDRHHPAVAAALLERYSGSPCAGQMRAALAASALFRDPSLLAETFVQDLPTAESRAYAIWLMLPILANRWLGRPEQRHLDWQDPIWGY